MGTLFVDAETDGLYGTFLSVAAIFLDDKGEQSDTFYGTIRNPEKYGLSLSNNVDGKKSDEKYFLVDEYGKKVDLSVTLKIENTAKEIGLDSIIIKPDEISDSEFFVKVLTPSISSYEIEFKFEKKDGSVFVFNFKVNQERKKKRYFILGELLRMWQSFNVISNDEKVYEKTCMPNPLSVLLELLSIMW